MKFTEKQVDGTMQVQPMDGGESSSMPGVHQNQIAMPPRSGRPPPAPSIPGILKARMKPEH